MLASDMASFVSDWDDSEKLQIRSADSLYEEGARELALGELAHSAGDIENWIGHNSEAAALFGASACNFLREQQDES
jgi:hypothetical protein